MMTTVGAHLLLLAALPALLGHGVGSAGGEVVALTGPAAAAPVFAPRQQTSVRGVQGRSVTLNCRVLQLGDKAVSWVRVRDLQILAHGGVVFTADARIAVPPAPAPVHALRIERLRATDAGRYECQLNTEPKMSQFFDLSVVDEAEAEAEAELDVVTEQEPWGEDEVEVWAVDGGRASAVRGGTAELACVARVLAEPLGAAPPLDIRWLRNGKPLTLQDGCAVSRLAGASYAESRLRLVAVSARDAGQYACAVGRRRATLHLTVTPPESLGEIEAMQRDQGAGGVGGAGGAGGGARAPRALLAALLVAALLAG